ncbi:MAG: PAS domain S-box protein [Balneolaceae bacterium]|nr:MAG: PAS domain S-box protein [Balneolaceae bacterium]
MVAKIDESELFEEVPGIFWSVMGMVLLGILFSSASMGFLYNHRQKSIYKELYVKEKNLWQQMEKFKVTMDSLGEGVIITDLHAKIWYLNNRAEELTGWRYREAQGRSLHDIYSVRNEDTGLEENNILDKVIKQGIVKELANHTLLVKKDGGTIPIVDTGAPVFDPERELIGIVITFRDETEKRNRQKLLEENELQFRNLFEFSADAVFIADAETGIILNANQAAEHLLDKPREKIIGLHQLSLHPDEKADYNKDIFQKAVENLQKRDVTEVVENEVVRADGALVPVEILASRVVYKGKKCLMGTFRNISERKKYESELHKLSTAIEQSPSSILITNVDGEIDYVNPAFTVTTGYTKESVLGKNPRILNSGLQSKNYYQNLWETITSGKNWRGEMCNRKKSGELYWELASISPVKNQEGVITHFIAVKKDITERKLAEERLRENEKYLGSLIKSVPDTIIVLNKNGEILDINASSLNYFPGTIQNLKKRLESLLSQEINKLQVGNSAESLKHKQVAKFQFELSSEDEEIQYHFSARAVLFGEDKVIITLSDITESIQNYNRINVLLRVEEEQSKRLQNFTHIVSHNLRSHTANMEGLFEILAMEEPEILENQYIKLMKESSDKLQTTIYHLNHILDINTIHREDWEKINLYKAVDNSIKSISNLIKNGGLTIYNRVPKGTRVLVIPAYLESIVLNLMTNAIKFRSDSRDSYLKITVQKKEGFTVVSFEDNGLGIDLHRHKVKLFGLYKTFHGHSDSRGLGLFMTKAQVEAMGGKIDVESEVDKGTTFKVYLRDE